MWPQIILGLVVDPDWLGCSVDDTKFGVVDVLGSVGFVMVNNVGLLGRSSDRKLEIKVVVDCHLASLIAACSWVCLIGTSS